MCSRGKEKGFPSFLEISSAANSAGGSQIHSLRPNEKLVQGSRMRQARAASSDNRPCMPGNLEGSSAYVESPVDIASAALGQLLTMCMFFSGLALFSRGSSAPIHKHEAILGTRAKKNN